MKRYMICITLFLITTTGCRNFLDVGNPPNQLISASVFENDSQAIAAMTNIYGQFTITNAMSYHIPFYLGIAGDEFTNYSTNGSAIQFYQNAPQPLNASSNGLWEVFYMTVYRTNAVLEGCEKSNGMSADVKRQLIAEAKFMRAFAYFYLVNLWGDVPLVTTTDYASSAKAPRSSSTIIYQQIISDLENASTDLNVGYVDASSKATYSERVRPNQAAAKAMLARVYLYNKNWSKAEENATSVISDIATYDIVALTDVFLKNNKEAIWQLMPSSTGSNLATIEGNFFILVARPTTSGLANCIAISPQLLAAFNTADSRRTNWIGNYIDKTVTPNITYYYPNKYKARTATSFVEYTTPLRLAEQYLIRAEARTEQNNLSGAKVDLNKVRARTNLGNTAANSQDELRNAIMKERQLELFAEWGHRWMDMKRTATINSTMLTVTPAKGGPAWSSNMQLFPIPQKDIEANKNLVQNNGYN